MPLYIVVQCFSCEAFQTVERRQELTAGDAKKKFTCKAVRV